MAKLFGAAAAPPTSFRSIETRMTLMAAYGRMLRRWPVPCTSRWVHTSRGAAHMLVSGPADGEPVLLLHSGGGNATGWLPNVEALSASLRVHALDIVGGAGLSDGPRPGNEREYCNWLVEVLDGLQLPTVALCGASFGAWLAAGFARRAPQRVSRLALLAPNHLAPLRLPLRARASMAALFPDAARVRALQRHLSSPHAPAPAEEVALDFLARWGCLHSRVLRPRTMTAAEMQALPRGTLVVLGEDEVLYDARGARLRLGTHAPQVRVEMLAAAGHAVAHDRAEAVSTLLLNFFMGHRAALVQPWDVPGFAGVHPPFRAHG